MFMVSDEDAAAIRGAYEQDGEPAAIAEVRRRFLAVANDDQARDWARTIAGWAPVPVPPDGHKKGRHVRV